MRQERRALLRHYGRGLGWRTTPLTVQTAWVRELLDNGIHDIAKKSGAKIVPFWYGTARRPWLTSQRAGLHPLGPRLHDDGGRDAQAPRVWVWRGDHVHRPY